ncbi:MAG: hypothetical protein JKY88_00945 [Pseudomonadales bacterium]|nr:hypothetical protein [Pseudomonadales bacterium]
MNRNRLIEDDTLVRNDILAEDIAFSDMVDRVKRRYRQLAEYLGVVCRVDLQTPKGQTGLIKVEKTLDTLLRELMSSEALVAISLVSHQENEKYVITINGHFQKKAWHKPEGIPSALILKAEEIGIMIKTTCKTGIKLSYDISLNTKHVMQ